MTENLILLFAVIFTAGFIVGGLIGYLFAISTEGLQDERANKL